MDTRTALLVDAYAEEPMAGSRVGVLPDGTDLSTAQLRAVAGELGADTAVVSDAAAADKRVRVVSPRGEDGRTDRAIVAAMAYLFERAEVDDEALAVETPDGVRDVEVDIDGTVWVDQPDPELREVVVGPESAADALGVDPAAVAEVADELPLARCSTGLPVLVVPVNFLEHLSGATPDREALAGLCADVAADGVYALTFDTLDGEADVHGRLFVPGREPTEVVASGRAAGAAGAYLRRFGAFDAMPDRLVVEGGHFRDRPARLSVRADDSVQVGGRAVTVLEGDLVVPEVDEDEIIEV